MNSDVMSLDSLVPVFPELLLAIGTVALLLLGVAFRQNRHGLIGGAVGGFKAGSVKRGLIAALLPAIAAGLGIWALLAVFDAPIIGFLSGLAFGVWALISSIGLLVGAMVGGAMAPPRPAEIR